MRVLIVGGGGREHALAWKIAQSPRLKALYSAPGNAGTAQLGENLPILGEDIEGILKAVKENQINLVIIGPEAPLAAGLSDALSRAGIRVFAPSKAAAAVEYSKEIAKELMIKYNIPTAKYAAFTDINKALAYIKEQGAPLVIKADGLAAGKGVIIAPDEKTAIKAAQDMLEKDAFGEAGHKIIIEEFLEGEEVSILAFCDGKTVIPMVSSQDHKRAFDGDSGPNTGGMGAYSPAPAYTGELAEFVYSQILIPTCEALKAEGRLYKGVLYAGLMITDKGIKVLEYNARFGDPETQAVLIRLKSDLLDIIEAVIDGNLDKTEIAWYEEAAVCIVIAAGGYPGKYEKGHIIKGIEEAQKNGAIVFQAGTALKDGNILTNGGRVLGVTALGENILEAINKAYKAAGVISFKDSFYRKDIGYKALNR